MATYMNYHTIGTNFVFALNLILPEGDRKDRPYAYLVSTQPVYARITVMEKPVSVRADSVYVRSRMRG